MYYRAAEAAMSNGHDFHVAALLWRNKSLIHTGVNQTKTSPRYRRYFPRDGVYGACLHAEMDVLRYARPGDVIEVLRVGKNGNFTMAHPCPHCFAAIKKAGIRTVRYTDWNGQWQTINMDRISLDDVADNFRANAATRGVPVLRGTEIPMYI